MITNKIKKAIELVKRTGDKIILFEENGDDGVVLMSVEEYEKLLDAKRGQSPDSSIYKMDNRNIGDLTEDELIDKVNRSIAEWQSRNQGQLDEYKMVESFLGVPEEGSAEEEYEDDIEDNFYYYDEEDLSPSVMDEDEEDLEEGPEKKEAETAKDRDRKGGSWEIPVNIKKDAEDVEDTEEEAS